MFQMKFCIIKGACLLFLIAIFNNPLQARNFKVLDTDTTVNATEDDKKNNYEFSVQYGNNISQNGRKMTSDVTYIRPAFNYSHSNGIYLGINVSYLPANKKKKKFDNVSFNLGYDKELGENFSIGIDYTYSRYFSAKQVASSIPNTIMLNGSWFNTIISPTLSVMYSFGDTSDFTMSLDISHVFSFKHLFTNTDKLTIPVVLGTYAGTSNFYKNYTKKNNITDTSGSLIDASSIKSSFGFTSAYLLTTVKYKISFFSVGGSVNFILPINQPKKITKNNHPVYSVQIAFNF
jgi:hypothetical protein